MQRNAHCAFQKALLSIPNPAWPSGNPFGCAAQSSGSQQVPFVRGRVSQSDISPGFGITHRKICCFIRVVSAWLFKASVPKSNSSHFLAILGLGTDPSSQINSMVETLTLYSEVKFHKLLSQTCHYPRPSCAFQDKQPVILGSCLSIQTKSWLSSAHQKKIKKKCSLFSVFTASLGNVGEILSFSTGEPPQSWNLSLMVKHPTISN